MRPVIFDGVDLYLMFCGGMVFVGSRFLFVG